MPVGGGCGVYPLAGSLVGNWLTVSSSGSSSLKPIVHRCLASLKTKFCVRVTDPQWQFIASLIKHGPRSKWIGSIRFCVPCTACDVKDLLRSLIFISLKSRIYFGNPTLLDQTMPQARVFLSSISSNSATDL